LFPLLLAAGSYVTLTVQPPDANNMPSIGGTISHINGGRPHIGNHERVTAPLPVNVSFQMPYIDAG